jgi:Erythromycin biosynthesis protein CIII-like, C-terminal domain
MPDQPCLTLPSNNELRLPNRVLIVWEFGSGLGHLACMPPIFRGLRARGIEPLVAVPDPTQAQRLFGAESPRMIRSVPLPLANNTPRSVHSHADILLSAGFSNVAALSAAVDGWQALFRDERIDCVVLDYAPVAQLAAWLMGLRMVTVSSAFAAPPVPLPALWPMTPALAPLLEASERELLGCVNQVITKSGHAPIDGLGPWLLSSTRFFTSIPQLSVFDVTPEGGYLGRIGSLQFTESVDWLEGSRRRVLCYLRWSPHTPLLIKSLDRADRQMLCAIPNAPEAWVRGLPSKRMRVFGKPVDLAPLMRDADLIVSHASAGVACEALIAGKPQLFIPIDREKLLIAQRLIRSKVALMLPPSRPASMAPASVQRLLDDAAFASAAKASAATLQPEQWTLTLERLLSTIAGNC